MAIPSIHDISCIVLDFDGVFTDNKVYTDTAGKESVCCSKADSMGLDLLRQYSAKFGTNVETFILSSETNEVVLRRADKIGLKCFSGCKNKADFIQQYCVDTKICVSDIVVAGNDINDLAIVKLAGYAVCPSDAHPLIVKNVDLVLPQKGGNGFVRALIEGLLLVEKMSEDDLSELLSYEIRT